MQISDASPIEQPAGLASRWRFLLTAAGLYVLWLVVYEGYVLPNGWLDHTLCVNLASVGAGLLRLVGFKSWAAADSSVVMLNGAPAVVVGTPCDGMALYALFAGFVLALPGPWRPKLWFVPLGILVIYLLNIIRIAMLAINFYYYHSTVDFNHHYTFTFVVYGFIGAMWMWWARHYGPAPATAPQ